jgi:hypothetical protein
MTPYLLQKSLFRSLAVFTCAALASVLSGCVAVAVGAAGAVGAGTVAYVRGELSTTIEGKYDAVAQACHRAVEDLRLAKISQRTDALTTVVVARTATDKKVTITVTKSSESLAQVRIRVGVFGDESLALAVLDKIKSFL